MGGTPFRVWKFRTMVDGDNPIFPDATRITSAGRVLRRLSLDELPQLINVATGEMSVVGPRPTLALPGGALRRPPAAASRGPAGPHRPGPDLGSQLAELGRPHRVRRDLRRDAVGARGPADPGQDGGDAAQRRGPGGPSDRRPAGRSQPSRRSCRPTAGVRRDPADEGHAARPGDRGGRRPWTRAVRHRGSGERGDARPGGCWAWSTTARSTTIGWIAWGSTSSATSRGSRTTRPLRVGGRHARRRGTRLSRRLDGGGDGSGDDRAPGRSIGPDVRLGDGVVVYDRCTVTTNVDIGAHTHLNVGCAVQHDSVVGALVQFSPGVIVNGDCVIDDRRLPGYRSDRHPRLHRRAGRTDRCRRGRARRCGARIDRRGRPRPPHPSTLTVSWRRCPAST